MLHRESMWTHGSEMRFHNRFMSPGLHPPARLAAQRLISTVLMCDASVIRGHHSLSPTLPLPFGKLDPRNTCYAVEAKGYIPVWLAFHQAILFFILQIKWAAHFDSAKGSPMCSWAEQKNVHCYFPVFARAISKRKARYKYILNTVIRAHVTCWMFSWVLNIISQNKSFSLNVAHYPCW